MSDQHQILVRGTPYVALMLLAILLTVLYWRQKSAGDQRLLAIYISGLVSAFLGAKIVFLLAEGWMYFGTEHAVLQIASGKTIVGRRNGGRGCGQ